MPDTKDELVERVAREIAEHLGDDFDAAFESKAAWIEARGGEPFRDVNKPYRTDYLEAARAALSASPVQELVEALEEARNYLRDEGRHGAIDQIRILDRIDATLAKVRNQ